MNDDVSTMKNVNDSVLEGNLRIVDSFSLPNFNTDNRTADPQDHPQNTIASTKDPPVLPTTFTLKKKKLEHFIDNLFKVASEKVTQPDDTVKTEFVTNDETVLNDDEGVKNGVVISDDLLKVEKFLLGDQEEELKTECVKIESNNEELEESVYDTNLVSFAQSVVEVKYSQTSLENVNLNVKSEHEACIKEEKDTKSAERMFGWCSIEDLKNPLLQNMTVSSSKVNINGDMDIKLEDFQSKLVG